MRNTRSTKSARLPNTIAFDQYPGILDPLFGGLGGLNQLNQIRLRGVSKSLKAQTNSHISRNRQSNYSDAMNSIRSSLTPNRLNDNRVRNILKEMKQTSPVNVAAAFETIKRRWRIRNPYGSMA